MQAIQVLDVDLFLQNSCCCCCCDVGCSGEIICIYLHQLLLFLLSISAVDFTHGCFIKLMKYPFRVGGGPF